MPLLVNFFLLLLSLEVFRLEALFFSLLRKLFLFLVLLVLTVGLTVYPFSFFCLLV